MSKYERDSIYASHYSAKCPRKNLENEMSSTENNEMSSTAKNVATIQPPQNDTTAMLSMIERAASNPDVDVDKMRALYDLRGVEMSRVAKVAYDSAMSELQPELPSVGERGKVAGRYTYALWEDINVAIKPILRDHGFALTFRTAFPDKAVEVTGVLSHRDGHREETSITLPADGSGNKNAVQAVASSVSYGKRYAAGALLNLTTHGEDDDAFAAVEPDADPSWYKMIDNANDAAELKDIADKIRAAGIAGRALRNIRTSWSRRKKDIAA